MVLGPERTLCEGCPARSASDALTGLADRRQFGERLAAALKGSGRRPEPVAVLLLDLDRFKAVNDLFGHPAGDALLAAAARRLRGALRPSDTAARLGGDEFAVLLSPAPDGPAIGAIGTRLTELLARPYLVAGRAVNVGVSIGIASAPEHGDTPERLMSRADLALYAAKAERGGRFLWFTPELEQRAESRRALESDLRAALPLGQLELHFQPQLDLASDRLAGFEALLRWRHPERGIVPPGDFIPLAEELNLLPQIGAWVIRIACMQAAGWPDKLVVAVNVGAQQFEDGRLPGIVRAALASSGLPPAQLELEITESALLQSSGPVLAQLHELQSLGVQVALDDFGTGYSSLTQLRSFRFDRVKIDRSFVDDAAVVRAVASLGASLGMRTVAEGVETRAQLARLRGDGCSDVQGYLLSRPVPADAVPALIGRMTAGSAIRAVETAP